MTESKHTPGPWYIQPDRRYYVIYSEECGALADVQADLPKANAQLIAAAPDLLVALEELIAAPNKKRPAEVWEAARAAIAKARGVEA